MCHRDCSHKYSTSSDLLSLETDTSDSRLMASPSKNAKRRRNTDGLEPDSDQPLLKSPRRESHRENKSGQGDDQPDWSKEDYDAAFELMRLNIDDHLFTYRDIYLIGRMCTQLKGPQYENEFNRICRRCKCSPDVLRCKIKNTSPKQFQEAEVKVHAGKGKVIPRL